MENINLSGHRQTTSHSSPDWMHGAAGPQTLSSFWIWECLAILAMPIVTLGIVAMAAAMGVIRLS